MPVIFFPKASLHNVALCKKAARPTRNGAMSDSFLALNACQ